MDKSFESKFIKREGKNPISTAQRNHSNSQKYPYNQMAFQISNNNNYTMAPTSLNLYISRKLNNIDQAQVMKKEREDWMRAYHKTLKGIETIINVQRILKDIKRVAEEANTMITEMKESILMASINNRTTNATNIAQISKDLQYLVQSNMDERVFQIQRILADEMDYYKGRNNKYVDDNIGEIQELYMDKKARKKEGQVEDEEVILIKPYKVSMMISSSS